MEKQYDLTQSEIVEIFNRWTRDANNEAPPPTSEDSVKWFCHYADEVIAERASLDEVDEQAAHEAAVEAGEKTEDEA